MYVWPHVDESLKSIVLHQLQSSLSDKGSKGVIKAVETKVARFYDMPYCLFFSSATGALHSLTFALNLQAGDEVIVPTYTFFASFSPLAYEGIRVVQADCDEHGQISIAELQKLVTPRTKGIVCTHMWGIPCDLTALRDFCDRHHLFLVEDCSHAHLGRYRGERLGRISEASIFSTNQKVLTSGEGGFLLTRRKDIYERALLFGHYNDRAKSEISDPALRRYALTGLGLKYRATTLSAAILSHQVDRAPEIERRRSAIYARFAAAVDDNPLLANIRPAYEFDPGLYVFPFLARDEQVKNRLLQDSERAGCTFFDAPGSTRPLFDQPLFEDGARSVGLSRDRAQSIALHASSFPRAIEFFARIVKLPLWGYEGDETDVEQCLQILRKFRG
jgi:perosamine synthetase